MYYATPEFVKSSALPEVFMVKNKSYEVTQLETEDPASLRPPIRTPLGLAAVPLLCTAFFLAGRASKDAAPSLEVEHSTSSASARDEPKVPQVILEPQRDRVREVEQNAPQSLEHSAIENDTTYLPVGNEIVVPIFESLSLPQPPLPQNIAEIGNLVYQIVSHHAATIGELALQAANGQTAPYVDFAGDMPSTAEGDTVSVFIPTSTYDLRIGWSSDASRTEVFIINKGARGIPIIGAEGVLIQIEKCDGRLEVDGNYVTGSSPTRLTQLYNNGSTTIMGGYHFWVTIEDSSLVMGIDPRRSTIQIDLGQNFDDKPYVPYFNAGGTVFSYGRDSVYESTLDSALGIPFFETDKLIETALRIPYSVHVQSSTIWNK